MSEIAAQINRVYRDREYVGSLVIDGPSQRPTEHDDFKVEPPWWCDSFWTRHERDTGMSRMETMQRLFEIKGCSWRPATRREMVRAVRTLPE